VTHLAEEDMVMHYYGEADEPGRAAAHLAECEECRRRFEELSKTLQALTAAPVPERGDAYGAQVWARLQPRLEAERERRPWWRPLAAAMTWPRLAAGGAIAVLFVAAFVAGRSSVQPSAQPERQHAEAPSDGARERVLLAAVGSHLDRSRVVLTEIAHRNGGDAADISLEQATASDLVADNRLYRQAAVRNGDAAVAAVLEDLERVLVEIASSPSPASHDDLARWREQIQTKGLLFKVTVMGSRVRERQQDAVPSRPAVKTST
jgi:hypothetical protein